jgi:hypothetical protein
VDVLPMMSDAVARKPRSQAGKAKMSPPPAAIPATAETQNASRLRRVLKMLRQIERFAYTWLLRSFAGLTLYIAFYAAFESENLSLTHAIKSMLKDKLFVILVVVSFALTISILLALDDQNRRDENLETMTFAGLAYVLLVRRKPLLALLVLGLVGVGLTTYYVAK